MPDKLGWRANWGVIAPSTNTSVQPEFDEMRPRGVTNHMSRIYVPDNPLESDDDFNKLMDAIRLEWDNAIHRVMTCNPDYLVMGMSSETFWGGLKKANELKAHMTGMTGLQVAMGSDACQAAIRCYGDIKKIAVLTPYWPVADENVTLFFNDCGFEIVALKGLCCPGPAAAPTHTGSIAAQAAAAVRAGAHAVSLAEVVGPFFITNPDEMFSLDRFHPSALGYKRTAKAMLPSVLAALGEHDAHQGLPFGHLPPEPPPVPPGDPA